MGKELTRSQQCALLAKKVRSLLGCLMSRVTCRVEGSNPSPLLSAGETRLGCCARSWAPQLAQGLVLACAVLEHRCTISELAQRATSIVAVANSTGNVRRTLLCYEVICHRSQIALSLGAS